MGSNHRPLPCQGSALPLSYATTVRPPQGPGTIPESHSNPASPGPVGASVPSSSCRRSWIWSRQAAASSNSRLRAWRSISRFQPLDLPVDLLGGGTGPEHCRFRTSPSPRRPATVPPRARAPSMMSRIGLDDAAWRDAVRGVEGQLPCSRRRSASAMARCIEPVIRSA